MFQSLSYQIKYIMQDLVQETVNFQAKKYHHLAFFGHYSCNICNSFNTCIYKHTCIM